MLCLCYRTDKKISFHKLTSKLSPSKFHLSQENLVSSKGKIISKTGDVITTLGRNIAKSAVQPRTEPPHPTYLYDHPPPPISKSFFNLNFVCIFFLNLDT